MPSLFQLGNDATEILGRLELAETDDEFYALADQLLQSQEDIKEKIDRYCYLIREIEARSSARMDESKRLRDLILRDCRASESLKARLKFFLEQHEIQRLETTHFRVGVGKNGGSRAVRITAAVEDLPEEFVTWEYVPSIDKARIRKALEAGIELPGVELEERGTHLVIQ